MPTASARLVMEAYSPLSINSCHGWVVMTSGGKLVERVYGRPADQPYCKNFIECVKGRERPAADIGIAHLCFAGSSAASARAGLDVRGRCVIIM